MFAKLATVNTCAAALLAIVPILSHAETQTEWLQRQLQITDGYSPPSTNAVDVREESRKEGPFEGTAMRGKQEKPVAAPSKGSGFKFSSDGRIFTQDGIEVSP